MPVVLAVAGCAAARGNDVVLRDGDTAIVNIQKSCADAYEIAIREVRSRGAVEFSSPEKLTISGRSRNMSIQIQVAPAEAETPSSRVRVVVKGPDIAREMQPGAEPPQVEIARSIALRAR